jgi:hypothetical protein
MSAIESRMLSRILRSKKNKFKIVATRLNNENFMIYTNL